MARNYYSELYFHFVWQTKGRLPLISPDIEKKIWEEIRQKSDDLGAVPLAVGGIEDHIHLLIGATPTIVLSEFIGKLKGSTSYYVNHELHSPRPFHWGEGYGVLSLAKRDMPAVRAYCLNQRKHHSRKTARPKMEKCNADDAKLA